MSWLVRLWMKFWRWPDDQIENPDIIVPHGYGLLSPTKLPDATEKTMLEAIKIAKTFPKAKIAFASADYFWSGCKQQEDKAKLFLLTKYGVPEERVIIMPGISNTVQEVLAIHTLLRDCHYRKIVVIADWMHTRSVQLIWKKLVPEAQIFMQSIQGKWDAWHPVVFQRSETRWLTANIARHILFRIFGKKIARIHYIIGRV